MARARKRLEDAPAPDPGPRIPSARERWAAMLLCPECGTKRDGSTGTAGGVSDGRFDCRTCGRRTETNYVNRFANRSWMDEAMKQKEQ